MNNEINKDKVIKNYKRLASKQMLEDINENEIIERVEDVNEDIQELYPRVSLSERMLVRQVIYQYIEEQNGYGLYKTHGIVSEKINDASITFDDSTQFFDPYVWGAIQRQLDDDGDNDKNKPGMYGWLV